MLMTSRLKEVIMEEIPDITSDMINKLKKLNINSVYQLAVQNPAELVSEFNDTSLNVESASILIANARKILGSSLSRSIEIPFLSLLTANL